jgi:1-acyl-sn-glycerol-3-phosphate acyltransferase
MRIVKENGKTTVYYQEITEDVVELKSRHDVCVDEKYEYLSKCWLRRGFDFFFYYCIAYPILGLRMKWHYGIKVVGKENLKDLKNTGFILYVNHSQVSDAFMPQVSILPPKRGYIIASHDSILNPFERFFTKSLGALPVPSTLKAAVNLNKAVKKILEMKQVVIIYPEAHSWPYYTKVREFPVTSFHFPVENNVPVLCAAVTYRKPKKEGRAPKITVTLSKPIYVKDELNKKEKMQYFHDEVYQFLKEKIETKENYEYYHYVKEENSEKEKRED